MRSDLRLLPPIGGSLLGLFIGEDDDVGELIGERYGESRVGVDSPDLVDSRSLGDMGKNVLISGITAFLLVIGLSLASGVTAFLLERGDLVRGL